MTQRDVIDQFRGAYAFLSNFYPVEVHYCGIDFPTVEHAYQASKSDRLHEMRYVQRAATPGEAKRRGRRITMRQDFVDDKVKVMRELLVQKFAPGSALAAKLLATGEAVLQEGNNWRDTYWGVCNGVGENHLGRILMQVRADLREGV